MKYEAGGIKTEYGTSSKRQSLADANFNVKYRSVNGARNLGRRVTDFCFRCLTALLLTFQTVHVTGPRTRKQKCPL